MQLNQPTAIVALSLQDSETKVLGFDCELFDSLASLLPHFSRLRSWSSLSWSLPSCARSWARWTRLRLPSRLPREANCVIVSRTRNEKMNMQTGKSSEAHELIAALVLGQHNAILGCQAGRDEPAAHIVHAGKKPRTELWCSERDKHVRLKTQPKHVARLNIPPRRDVHSDKRRWAVAKPDSM